MGKLFLELNNFTEATTVHGFAYLSKGQTLCTRLIWSLTVIGAAVVAAYFLYETINGFDEKYTSTTIETRSVKKFPYPAITFHPGDFNSENAFLQTFFNQFEFTRYSEKDKMRDNNLFLQKFGALFVSPMNTQIFEGVQKYLLEEKLFINKKGGIFRNEICSLLALSNRKIEIQSMLLNKFKENIYKIRGFRPVMKFIKNDINQDINSMIQHYNVSKSEVSSVCKDPKVLVVLFYRAWLLRPPPLKPP